MTIKIWTGTQMQQVSDLQTEHKIPQEVVKAIKSQVEMLDAVYGTERDADNDDGGYVLLLLPDKDIKDRESIYLEVLKKYHFHMDTAEVENILYKDECWEWYSDLFLSTNEYGVTVIYPLCL